MPELAFLYISAVTILLATILWKILTHQQHPDYPPGPSGQPLIGTLLDIPDKKPWLTYTDWAKRYGDIIHLQAMGDHIIVLNSINTANDLLEKRSRIYSGRPHEDVAVITGWNFNLGLQDYSDTWRKNRKVYQEFFRPNAVMQLCPVIEQRISVFLQDLFHRPKQFMEHIDMLSGGFALQLMYGISIDTGHHPLIPVAKTAIHTMEQVFTPLLMPVLKHCPFVMSVPHWFPILGPIRRLVETTRKHLNDLRDLPIQYVQKNEEADAGLIPPLLHEINEGDPSSTEQARRIKDVGTTVYAAGADTTSSSTGTFFLAMARNIHSQKKAQQEIDAVVGRGRLPNLDDRDSLPYVEAVYQEVMRWYPPLPLGVPHMATTDDNYRGYYIPQGALVFANIWNMTHDEEIYPDPYCFKPERFLNTQRNINDVLAYGFGRRICVGRHLADTELWLTFASVLACFDITNEKDEYGNEIVIPENYSDGPVFFSHPLPFRCNITPRHMGVESLITRSC